MLSRQLASLLRPGGAADGAVHRRAAPGRGLVRATSSPMRTTCGTGRRRGRRWARKVWPVRDIEVLLAPLEVQQTHLLAHHQREMLLRQPLAPGKAR